MSLGREMSKAFSGLEKRIVALEKENARLRKKVEGETERKSKSVSRAAKKDGGKRRGRPPKVRQEEGVAAAPKRRGRPPVDKPVKPKKKRGRPPLPEHMLKHNPFAHRLKPQPEQVEKPEPVAPPEEIEIDEDKDLATLNESLPEDDDDDTEDLDGFSDDPFADGEPEEGADDE